MINAAKLPPGGWYLIHIDGHLIDNPKDWQKVPAEAMPAIKFIIKEVENGKQNK